MSMYPTTHTSHHCHTVRNQRAAILNSRPTLLSWVVGTEKMVSALADVELFKVSLMNKKLVAVFLDWLSKNNKCDKHFLCGYISDFIHLKAKALCLFQLFVCLFFLSWAHCPKIYPHGAQCCILKMLHEDQENAWWRPTKLSRLMETSYLKMLL